MKKNNKEKKINKLGNKIKDNKKNLDIYKNIREVNFKTLLKEQLKWF